MTDSKSPTGITLRETVTAADRENVRRILASSGFFHDHEIEVGVELVDERLGKGLASGYLFLFADTADGKCVGYTCYGEIACTVGSYDLYWIAVDNTCRGLGVGGQLMLATEERIKAAGGRKIYIETSGKKQYVPTQGFYLKYDYILEATLKDFYAPADDKLMFTKTIVG